MCFFTCMKSLSFVILCGTEFLICAAVVLSSSMIRVATLAPLDSQSLTISFPRSPSMALEVPSKFLWHSLDGGISPLRTLSVHRQQSLIRTPYPITFPDSFPITDPTPDKLSYLRPDDHFCHPISYLIAIWIGLPSSFATSSTPSSNKFRASSHETGTSTGATTL